MTAVRAVLWAVIVAGVALSVFWAATGTPVFGLAVRVTVAVVVAAAAVAVAALPRGRRRKGDRK